MLYSIVIETLESDLVDKIVESNSQLKIERSAPDELLDFQELLGMSKESLQPNVTYVTFKL